MVYKFIIVILQNYRNQLILKSLLPSNPCLIYKLYSIFDINLIPDIIPINTTTFQKSYTHLRAKTYKA